eukprot:TRINITY_DN63790_c0_g1_i1.p1 TRINITY_DN63790_c0_g1~~TRINITY_DN63790_c0_g1_i1.p1  ORF type:complete len:871 (-),score=303.32 TRINITY_DN63790_c0_g1_i1:69-2585(-)
MEEGGDSQSALEVLQQDYRDTLEELSGAKAQVLAKFKEEYEKLYTALDRSHASEKSLAKRIRELNAEIAASVQSVQTAMKAAAEDQQTIQTLKRDIEANEQLVREHSRKEATAQEHIAQLKQSIADLTHRIEYNAGLTPEQEATMKGLKTKKEQLEKDRDMLKQNNEMLQGICLEMADKVHRADLAKANSEDQIIDIKQKTAEKRAEVEAEKRRKEDLEQQMKDLRIASEQHQEELAGIGRTIQAEETELRKVEQDVIDVEKEEERLERRVRQRMEEKRKLEEKLEQELAKNQKYVQENQQRELAFRARRDDIQQHHTEREKVLKMHEALKKKEKGLDDERKALETQRNELKAELKGIQDETETLKKDTDVDRKKIEDLLRERDILNKNVIKADERTKKQIDLVKRQETQAMNMQKDIARWKQEAADFKNRIVDLEKQREKYGVELSQANAKYFAAQEELRMRASRLTELKKQIANVQAKRNKQKNLYDAVCMDRNLHAKNLVESSEQITEMRRKFKIMFHQTTALKEEIREKDNRLVRDIFKHKKVLQLNERLKESKESKLRRMKNLINIVETQRTQMKKLEGTIQEAEQQRQAQLKELEGVTGERDILGAQLIRRNEELALLYEKIKIQQSTLQKGEIQYEQRLKEIAQIKEEIRKAKADAVNAKNQVTSIDSLKREIHHLGKTLLREEAKAKALQEELENPMNVHRWRELAGSDPATFDMITKVKSLQKKLIAKTEEVVEKDHSIQEKEKLYVQLRSIISRQPGPEVAEQLAWYSQNLKEKTQHMKQMAVELENYHEQVQDLKDEIGRHNKDFQNTKQQYFQRLRQQRAAQEALG